MMQTQPIPLSDDSMRALIRAGVVLRSHLSNELQTQYGMEFREQEAKEAERK
jgi:hypothetical protein